MSAQLAPAVEQATLYQRLGSYKGIAAIAEDIWANHISNPTVKNRYVNSDPVKVKRLVTDMCCAGFGGPETYTGRDMLTTHRGMNISEEEFIAICDDVLNALKKNKAGQRECDEVLCILYSLKGEIIRV
jgi:hemoglobin